MIRSSPLTFCEASIDRMAHLRADQAAITKLMSAPTAKIYPFWRAKPMVQGEEASELGWVLPEHALIEDCSADWIFLGQDEGIPCFAANLIHWQPDAENAADMHGFLDETVQIHPEMDDGQRFAELRSVMARLSPKDAEIAATARGLLSWHHSHGFCARCGARSVVSHAGWQRQCPACNSPHFPRTDPVVIMLITHGNDVLIGRSPGWPEGMYSLLAGFMEPGETMETAVRREVFEETGVRVGPVRYLSSQPWPFPASLMIGAAGQALTREINLDPVELEDAQWISREEMVMAFSGAHPWLTPARDGAIAKHILQQWLMDTLGQTDLYSHEVF